VGFLFVFLFAVLFFMVQKKNRPPKYTKSKSIKHTKKSQTRTQKDLRLLLQAEILRRRR